MFSDCRSLLAKSFRKCRILRPPYGLFLWLGFREAQGNQGRLAPEVCGDNNHRLSPSHGPCLFYIMPIFTTFAFVTCEVSQSSPRGVISPQGYRFLICRPMMVESFKKCRILRSPSEFSGSTSRPLRGGPEQSSTQCLCRQ